MVPFLVKKGFFQAVFWGFWLPDKQDVPGNQEAANQRLSLHIHTIERWEGEQRGATSGQKGGCLGCFGGFSAPGGTSGCRTSSTSHGKPPNLARFLGIPRVLGLFSILIRS